MTLMVSDIVEVCIVKAENLRSADLNGLSDPFVSISTNVCKNTRKTTTVYGSLNPVWNENFSFFMNESKPLKFAIQVMDYDRVTKNVSLSVPNKLKLPQDFLGSYSLIVSDEIFEVNKECPLTINLDKTKTGTLQVVLFIRRNEQNIAISKIDMSQYQKITDLDAFSPSIPKLFSISSCSETDATSYIMCNGPSHNPLTKSLETFCTGIGLVDGLDFELFTRNWVGMMQRVHSAISKKTCAEGVQVTETDVDLSSTFACGKYLRSTKNSWKYTNADKKQVSVLTVTAVEAGHMFHTFVYCTTAPEGITAQTLHMLHECALLLVW